MPYRARHAKPSRLRTLTCTAGLSTALAVPLTALTAPPAAAHSVPARSSVTASSLAPAVGLPTLRLGARGSAVAVLQRRLGGLAADGAFGPRTRRAVVAFQSRRGLAADGIVGPVTWRALGGRTLLARASRSGVRLPVASARGAAAVAEAARHAGKPYVFGATGPNAFDCSGFVQYVYRRVGVSLPRTSAQQAAAARPVSQSSKRLGDLIIFRSSGRVTHVGIYAGNGTMWVARRSGTTVTRQRIYTTSYSVGRVA